MSDSTAFTLNRERHTLTRAQVEQSVGKAVPEPIQTWGVEVGGRVFPVKQVFALATGEDRADFISHTARRHLKALDFRLFRAAT